MIVDVGGVVAGGGVPGDDDGLAGELERNGALDGAGGAVAGLPGGEDLLAVFYRHFHGPPGGVPLDDGRGGRGSVGADQGQVVAGLGLVADEHDGDRAGAEDRVPQAGDGGGLDGGGLAVAGDGDRSERCGGGERGEGGEPVAFLPGPPAPAGAGRRQPMQRRVLAQPGGPGDAGQELLQLAAGVGRVSDHVDVAAGQRAGDGSGHAAGQPQPGRGAGALDDQLGQHRDGHRPAEGRQPHDHGRDHPIVAVPRFRGPRRGAVVEPRCRPHLLAAPLEQGVVDRHDDRLACGDQQRHHQPGDGQAQLVRAPPGAGEEPVRPVMAPQPGKARPGQHAAHRPLPGLREETAGQAAERAERRGGEQRGKAGQQRHQRRGNR